MNTQFDYTKVDFSKSRVRYEGLVQDKLDLSKLIRYAASSVGIHYVLHTDIYWDSYSYKYLKFLLKEFVSKLINPDYDINFCVEG